MDEPKGWNIALLRALSETKFSTEEVAWLIGTTQNDLIDFVRGYTPPGETTKKHLATVLGKPVEALFEVKS